MVAFCPVSAAHVPNIFAHTLYVLFVQENVGTLYCNIFSKKASSLGFFMRVHAYVHAGMCVTEWDLFVSFQFVDDQVST